MISFELKGERVHKAVKMIFGEIINPRTNNAKVHPLMSILYVALCAIMAGKDSFSGMDEYGINHEKSLKKYIDSSNGIASHDTLGS